MDAKTALIYVGIALIALIFILVGIDYIRYLIINDKRRSLLYQVLDAVSETYQEAEEEKQRIALRQRKAVERANTEHDAKLRRLAHEQEKEAENLHDDPDALSRALVDAGKPEDKS